MVNTIFIFCLTIMLNNYDSKMNKSFEILKINEIENVLRIYGRSFDDFDSMLGTTNNFVYKLEQNKIVLLPNHLLGDKEGIVYYSADQFNNDVMLDKFPIPNEYISVYEENIDLYSIINETDEVFDIISDLLDFKLPSKSLNIQNLSLIFEQIGKANLKSKEKDLSLFAFGLLYGSYLVNIKNYSMILKKQYGTFNPYFVPVFIDNEGYVQEYFNVIDSSNKWGLDDFELFEKAISQNPVRYHLDTYANFSSYPLYYNLDFTVYKSQ